MSKDMTEPTIVERTAQPYVAVKDLVTMTTFAKIADRFGEIFAWLGAHGIEPTGAPFFKYNVIDMEHELEVEAGVPIATATTGEGDILAGVLPEGRYVTSRQIGHPDQLIDRTAELLDWTARQGLRFDMSETDAGERWGCRLEIYLTDPAVQPDMNHWETQLAFRLADQR